MWSMRDTIQDRRRANGSCKVNTLARHTFHFTFHYYCYLLPMFTYRCHPFAPTLLWFLFKEDHYITLSSWALALSCKKEQKIGGEFGRWFILYLICACLRKEFLVVYLPATEKTLIPLIQSELLSVKFVLFLCNFWLILKLITIVAYRPHASVKSARLLLLCRFSFFKWQNWIWLRVYQRRNSKKCNCSSCNSNSYSYPPFHHYTCLHHIP